MVATQQPTTTPELGTLLPQPRVATGGQFICPCGSQLKDVNRGRINRHYDTKKHRQWLANWMLEGVRVEEELRFLHAKFGEHSVEMGDNVKMTSTSAPVAAGELGYIAGALKWFDTALRVAVSEDGAQTLSNKTMGGDLAMGANKVTGLGTDASSITASTDAANKAYVDSVATGLSVHGSVRVRAQGNIVISGPGSTIDGISMVAGDRVLMDQQTTFTEDGIYIWNGAAVAMTRASDAAISDTFAGVFLFVEEGTNADEGFVCTNDTGTDVVGTNDLTFTQFSGAGAVIAGDGLTKTGSTIDADNAAPALTLGTTNTAGTADTGLLRVDATIAAFDATLPASLTPDNGGNAGTAGVAARRDHTHDLPAAAPGTALTSTTTNAEGSAASAARSDHTHAITASASPGAAESLLQSAADGSLTLTKMATPEIENVGSSMTLDCQDAATTSIALTNQGAGDAKVVIDSELEIANGDMVIDANKATESSITYKNEGLGATVNLLPGADNQNKIGLHTELGDSVTTRWAQMVATTLKTGDMVLDNGWRVTEQWDDGSVGPRTSSDQKSVGTLMLNAQGEKVFLIDEAGNLRIKGQVLPLT